MFVFPEKQRSRVLYLAAIYPFAVLFADSFFPIISCFPNLYPNPSQETSMGIWIVYALLFLGPPLALVCCAMSTAPKRLVGIGLYALVVPPLLYVFVLVDAYWGSGPSCAQFMPTLRALASFLGSY